MKTHSTYERALQFCDEIGSTSELTLDLYNQSLTEFARLEEDAENIKAMV